MLWRRLKSPKICSLYWGFNTMPLSHTENFHSSPDVLQSDEFEVGNYLVPKITNGRDGQRYEENPARGPDRPVCGYVKAK
jgi:hypothetical protein